MEKTMSLTDKIKDITKEIQAQYLEDDAPWVIGYSGGKDSTTILQLVMYALARLPKEQLTKEVHVLTNDTLVENPKGPHISIQVEDTGTGIATAIIDKIFDPFFTTKPLGNGTQDAARPIVFSGCNHCGERVWPRSTLEQQRLERRGAGSRAQAAERDHHAEYPAKDFHDF